MHFVMADSILDFNDQPFLYLKEYSDYVLYLKELVVLLDTSIKASVVYNRLSKYIA